MQVHSEINRKKMVKPVLRSRIDKVWETLANEHASQRHSAEEKVSPRSYWNALFGIQQLVETEVRLAENQRA